MPEIQDWGNNLPINMFSVLDPWDKKNWPTPWELLQEGYYCETTKCFLMAKTIESIYHINSRLIYLIDKDNEDEYCMVELPGVYMNYNKQFLSSSLPASRILSIISLW